LVTGSIKSKFARDVPLGALLALITCASLIPVVLLGAYGIKLIVDAERVQETRRLAEVARALGQSVDRELDTYREKINVLATSPTLQHDDLTAFARLARDMSVQTESRIILVDRTFRQRVNTRSATDTALPETNNRDVVEQVLRTGKPMIGNLLAGSYSKQLAFTVVAPVFVDGIVKYALALGPDPSSIQYVLRQNYVPDGWLGAIIDRNATILARSERFDEFFGKKASGSLSAVMTKQGDTLETVDLDGRHAITSYVTSPISGWRTVVWAPKAVIAASSRRLQWLTSGLAALTLLISIASAVLLGILIKKPANQVVASAHALSAGDPVVYQPSLMREANMVHRAMAEASDVIAKREYELRVSEEHTKFIMRELSHRSKNLLAIIQSMARQTGRNSSSMAEFERRFEERISGLARSHDLLIGRNWQGAMLADLVESQLKPFVDDVNGRVEIIGPDLLIRPAAAHTLGMVLHELATNASKYGALSNAVGRIAITWNVDHRIGRVPRFHMTWRESGGPLVSKPTRQGFGHIVIERMTASAFGGTAAVSWDESGFTWKLEAVASAIDAAGIEEEAEAADVRVRPVGSNPQTVSTPA
jgi:two-component sensor histidine kinase